MLRGESYIDFCTLWVIMMFACGREGGGASVTNDILKFRKVVEFETSGIVICFSYIYRYVQKVGRVPGPPAIPEPRRTSKSPENPQQQSRDTGTRGTSSNLQDTAEPLGTPRSFLGPPVFLRM